ncbi:hypothetical protein B296_00013121 [Ensete ventricosum]|uniref:Dilute domain-containing protein n=1 Tax=Ensete ventricosum TaxID=4639 RepID=A0A427AG85_ENSVE|nr:hypothetical protein B296_00013121 [Ensete ventricosum]
MAEIDRPRPNSVVLPGSGQSAYRSADRPAARETGALQAAKNKLEKQVEELTWRLQLEKRIRVNIEIMADMEEANTQENAKLQAALQEMQQKFDETKALLVKEQEAAKQAAEQVPVVKEIPVIDTVLMDKLRDENEKLKALVSSLEMKIDESEKKYEETSRISEERLKKATEAESKIVNLNNAIERSYFSFRSSSSVNLAVDGLSVVRQVEAKYPALLFKQQLTAYVEKIYGIIRDNVKKDLSSLLSLCIQV